MSDSFQKKIAGQSVNHILKTIEDIFKSEGDHAALVMKNHLAITFFKMIINEESIDDHYRSMARSYMRLFEFLSNFDEALVVKK